MAVEPWRTGTVIRIEDETYNTKRYFIEVKELDTFNFKAGQFVTLDLPIHEQKIKDGAVTRLQAGLTIPMCLNY